ncbi:hypothetical protein K2173_022512 [Erythroxylum novogranatense]|uniref:DUF4378 domain-containing protein n=1 Tax=Erythroxylum novogranatense TaxID=1862640 RepID=A0AAV8TI69_9ROSI|nr:hypothetical protein K2173_022512 [Erythroxylum novogranatense]
MGFEKEGSKNGGGYVGGFFQLFDWTAKSRKKLFSSKSDFPEHTKQGKRSDGNFPRTRIKLMNEDETGAGSSIIGSSDYSCASSVTDDDGYGARAPGLVARLMGLDSLPTSNSSEPNSTPFFDTQSLQDASNCRKHFYYYHDHQVAYSGNLLNRDGPPRNFAEPKPQKVLSRPIEKFQTEMLPPKSAKSIPITHHKLLSPIKSPGFIPSKTAAHIMEAAAKIIESGPQTTSKAKMPVIGTSSVPLRVRDMKDKLEVAQKVTQFGSSSVTMKVRDPKEKTETSQRASRLTEPSRKPVESNAAKYLKGQSMIKSWNGAIETSSKAVSGTEEGSSGQKAKGKSISLAIQAKVNVQRREGLASGSSQALVGQKEQNEVPSSQPFKSQPNLQKSFHKKNSAHSSAGALRQNNQKQNCLTDKDKLSSKASVPSLQSRKVVPGNPSSVRHKISVKTVGPKIGSRKLGIEVTDSESRVSSSNTMNVPRKRRSIDGNMHRDKTQAVENMFDNDRRAVEPNAVTDKHLGWAEEGKRKGMDVVSFTFTAPLTRCISDSGPAGHVVQKNTSSCTDNRGKRLLLDAGSMKLPSAGYNVIGGDALSALLEQKLRELTKSVESSCTSVQVGSVSSSALSFQDLSSTLSIDNRASINHNRDQIYSDIEKSDISYDSDLLSTNSTAPRYKHLFQGVDNVESFSHKSSESRNLLDRRGPSPISVLEPSFSNESCSSLDSMDSSSTEVSGNKQCSSIHAQQINGLSSSKNFHYVDADMELSDSASSTCTGALVRKNAHKTAATDLARSPNWEIEYIKKILLNLDFVFQNFVLSLAPEMVNPRMFDQLEDCKNGFQIFCSDDKLERKLLFDCVSECLDLKCRPCVGGGHRIWAKGEIMVRRKDRLAEEVFKEITEWRRMGDCMVDELVDKDMSSHYGRWLDFQVDECALAAEVEGQIFNSLINEVVADVLRF